MTGFHADWDPTTAANDRNWGNSARSYSTVASQAHETRTSNVQRSDVRPQKAEPHGCDDHALPPPLSRHHPTRYGGGRQGGCVQ